MKKKNSKETIKKVQLDAFELRFSEEKLEIEAKSLQWKTVVSSVNDLYGYFNSLSETEEGKDRLLVRLRFMYFASFNRDFDPVIYASSNMFYDLLGILAGDESTDEMIDENLKLTGDVLKEYFKEIQEKVAEKKALEIDDAEILEEEKIMEQLKQEDK